MPAADVGLLHECDRARVLDLGQRLKGSAALRLRLQCHAQVRLKLLQVLLTGGPPCQARKDGFQRHGLPEQHGLDRLHVAALDLLDPIAQIVHQVGQVHRARELAPCLDGDRALNRR